MLSDLIKPFPAADIEWRAGATNQDKTRALAMAYLTSRAVMNRLDDVIGPENWKDEYSAGPQGGIMCGISIYTENGWVTKFDVGENSDFEPVKGGFSDAFKRAAVKWGIGRYLYNLDAVWHECEVRGKSVVLKGAPALPKWALPEPTQQAPVKNNQPERKPQPAPQAEAAPVKATRPYDPETLKTGLTSKVAKMANERSDPAQLQAVAACISAMLNGDDQRHEFIRWLDGCTSGSLKDCKPGTVPALYAWLKPVYNKEAKVFEATDEFASYELTHAHAAGLVEAGQQELI